MIKEFLLKYWYLFMMIVYKKYKNILQKMMKIIHYKLKMKYTHK